MGSQTPAKATLFLAMNLLCFVLTTACGGGTCGNPSPPATGGGPGGGQSATCPRDALKLGVCANLLGGLVGVVVGSPPTIPCCTLLAGLADLEAAVCLCTAIRANVLGINLNIPISLSLLLNVCGRTPPTGFTCA
ncbi:14 kDa proline-rich protein DC2.15-like [Olea europaea var. sylvestris]|uniref:Bifunctional inhibitor/plant lipid transfer protein/seed storage helical domain-containing protein n=1 Tax=Olea europaea subsp. europaea TaxID=158383 RepID=A0A8S0SBT9_OLEEU|nr:14 kDa proline-rich protein DC2.15-like [Olea europaea var. sylvestris]CAA2988665.1 Hypothetical predicted protein [Olea europaea subsp. europaea]